MPSARLTIDPAFTVGRCDRRLFGSFVEHLGRCVYDGIYEPDHPTADEDGFRARRARRSSASSASRPSATPAATSCRASAGRTASARATSRPPPRPRLALDRDQRRSASTSSPAGSDEAGSRADARGQPRHPGRAARRSTCSSTPTIRAGTALSGRSASRNGRAEPFGVKMWCLGNEMDGPWQLGHRSADGLRQARRPQTAKAMRQLDPSVELVVCGSSSAQHADLRRVGAHRARRTPTTTSTSSPATPTTRSTTATSAASSPRPSTWTTSSSRSSRPPTTCGASSRARRRSTSRSTSGTSGTSTRYQDVDKIAGHRRLAGGPAPARGHLLGRRRRRGRQPADLAAASTPTG